METGLNTESEAPTVARCAALVGYAQECLEMALKGIRGGDRVLYQEANHSRLWVQGIAEGSFVKFSGEPWTIKKKLVG